MSGPERTRMEGGRCIRGFVPEQPPLVSVIIAVYNSGATLERAIQSVVSQTMPRVELILIDGGSTDGSLDLLKRYEHSIDYWLSEPDAGIYDALNKGISRATGEWLYFLGSDDVLVDDNVFASVFSQPHDTGFLYGDVFYGDTGEIYGGAFSKRMLLKVNLCQQGIFYRAGLFTVLGAFDLTYPLVADWEFNMRAFARKDVKPVHIDVVIARYSLAGASSKMVDSAFARDRYALVMEHFGLSYWALARLLLLKDHLVANYRKYVVKPLRKIRPVFTRHRK